MNVDVEIAEDDLKRIWRKLLALIGKQADQLAWDLLRLLREFDTDAPPAGRQLYPEVRALIVRCADQLDENSRARVLRLLDRTLVFSRDSYVTGTPAAY